MMPMVLACALAIGAGRAARADGHEAFWQGEVHAILDGVTSVPAPGIPGTLVAFGEDAFPLLVNERGETVLAGAMVGNGRVVAFGHGGLLASDAGDGATLRANILRYLAEGKARVRVFGVDDALIGAAGLEGLGTETERVEAWPGSLNGIDVVFGSVDELVRERGLTVGEIRAWLEAGGGLLAADTAWGYLQLKHADRIEDLPCNRLMLPEGLAWTNTLRDAPGGEAYPVPEGDERVPRGTAHALLAAGMLSEALGAGEAGSAADRKQAVASVSEALAAVPGDVEGMKLIEGVLRERAGRADVRARFEGMGETPLKPETDALACVVLDLESRAWLDAPVDAIRAHPSAVAFPGAVPADAPRETAEIALDTAIPGWRTTGLYAAPGEVVTLRFPEEAIGAGVVVQIGAWRDPQSFDVRVRMRNVIRRWDVDSPAVRIASPVGGPIYVDLPAGLQPERLGVQVEGAVRAPHYRLGVTDDTGWLETGRFAPAPWAELETDELVITVPSETVRDLENPAELMAHWNRVHDAMHELEPRQPTHWSDRQFRYVSEKRLSWGYMYCPSDGPIVVPTSASDEATDLTFITLAAKQPTMWGWYHEMGHSHQNPMWTFNGLGEVTVNIFTVYVLDRVLGVDPSDDVRARMGPTESWKRYEAFMASDKAFPGDPFTGLAMYALLWQEFGWEPYRRVFAEYRSLPAGERPRNDQEKRDQWLIRMSRAVGRDLGPYFETWRVGASEAAHASVADLPAWMPVRTESDPLIND